jgi:hypothetical protein
MAHEAQARSGRHVRARAASLILAMVVGVVMALAAAAPVTAGGAAARHGRLTHLQAYGTTSLSRATRPARAPVAPSFPLEFAPAEEGLEHDLKAVAAGGLLGVPSAPSFSVTKANPNAHGFDGLSHFDSRNADNGNQFSLEPPDQGLCVARGLVFETINSVLAVYKTDGTLIAGPISQNAFYAYPVAIDRTTGVFGPFVTDPKCLFDAATGRWFHTTLTLDTDPKTGALVGTSHVDIAVSQTSDPTGTWALFHLDTTNGLGGRPNHPNCPCFGDQPLIGADKWGFYISTNEFPLFKDGFNGAQIYAVSKWRLAEAASSGTSPGTLVAFDGLPLAEGIAYSVQPATSPNGSFASARGGTEYFLSALQFGPSRFDNRIAIWALSNTSSLGNPAPAVSLRSTVIGSEVYGQPGPIRQRNGFLSLNTTLPLVNSNDDRMNQVVYADGLLWSGLNSVVRTPNGNTPTGIAYFIVKPVWTGSTLHGHVRRQGYVAVNGNSVVFPAIGVNRFGKAVMTFSLIGPSFYPSAAYVRLDEATTNKTIHVIGVGAGPVDGFTALPDFDKINRWGDYSAALVTPNGRIWVATEYIPGTPRTLNANWGTFIAQVNP